MRTMRSWRGAPYGLQSIDLMNGRPSGPVRVWRGGGFSRHPISVDAREVTPLRLGEPVAHASDVLLQQDGRGAQRAPSWAGRPEPRAGSPAPGRQGRTRAPGGHRRTRAGRRAGDRLGRRRRAKLEHLGAGDRVAGNEHRQHGALPSLGVAGSAAGSVEPTSAGVRVTDRLLTTREVGELVGLSTGSVLRRCRAGEIPGFRIAFGRNGSDAGAGGK